MRSHHVSTPNRKRDFSFSNPAVRAWLYQIIAIVAVVAVAGYLIHNTIINLASRGITSGFGFLERSAGFGIVQHLIDYSEGDTYARVFLVGLTNTLLVSALCIVFASFLGFFIGLARLSDNWLLRKISNIYIETFRNIPPLLQIFFWYFAVLRNLPGPRQALNAFDLAFVSNRGLYIPWPEYAPGTLPFLLALLLAVLATVGLFRYNKKHQLKTGQLRRTWPAAIAMLVLFPLLASTFAGSPMHWDIPELKGFNYRGGFVLIPELAALTLALSIYTSSFIAEVIRSGIQSVPHGQHEAARSLGLPNPVTLRQVIIPQAMRVIIPPLTSQYLNIVKNSSLAAAIGYPDMVSLFAGTVLNQTGQAIETIAITMGVYLIISLTISLLMNIYNRKIALIER
ncbi:amino acid ABC transporter permease [Erwinia aphidicola]|uniref:amino acid ABC transporter permease n=1 Tax=Erwinia aphidicola TaxID=68334 RepID=UPI0030CC30E3